MKQFQVKNANVLQMFSLEWCTNWYAGLVTLLRLMFYVTILIVLDQFLEIDTPTVWLCTGAIAGVLLASFLAFSWFSTAFFIAALLICWGIWSLATSGYLLIPANSLSQIFNPYLLVHHGSLVILTAALTCISTWCFWRFRHGLTIELLAIAFLFIDFLSGHRNLRFDMVKPVADLAWHLNIEQLTAFVAIGGLLTLFLGFYLAVASWPYCPRPPVVKAAQVHRAPWPLWLRCLLSMSALGLLYALTIGILFYYTDSLGSRLSNGVGFDPEVGEDPLDDYESLGKYSQPTAVVRLEGDYPDNPFSPMLFFRETALSDIDGNTIVVASKEFDNDISKSHPSQNYRSDGDPTLEGRTPVVQTVYMLHKSSLAFALDMPLSIQKGKPPSDKFVSAYQVYSMAPTYKVDELRGLPVGDSRWTKEQLAHYTEPHPDPRYGEMARELTAGIADPVLQAQKIQQYMIDNSIYTLQPGHPKEEGSDVVAKYLFGDLRGYCVHFSKAGVYMLRALGIPSRVATGYLTDLSQSRDGHILLRMSDRHAWTEVYISGKGWVPFDVQPTQVEVHAETPVDQEKLMELMDMIGLNFELLDDDLERDEPALTEESDGIITLPDPRTVIIWILSILVAFMAGKLMLRYYWYLPAPAAVKLKRGYKSSLMVLHDLGINRQRGETRKEFAERVYHETGRQFLSITPHIDELAYAPNGKERIRDARVEFYMKQELDNLQTFPRWKRALAFMNPSSLGYWIFRYRW